MGSPCEISGIDAAGIGDEEAADRTQTGL